MAKKKYTTTAIVSYPTSECFSRSMLDLGISYISEEVIVGDKDKIVLHTTNTDEVYCKEILEKAVKNYKKVL